MTDYSNSYSTVPSYGGAVSHPHHHHHHPHHQHHLMPSSQHSHTTTTTTTIVHQQKPHNLSSCACADCLDYFRRGTNTDSPQCSALAVAAALPSNNSGYMPYLPPSPAAMPLGLQQQQQQQQQNHVTRKYTHNPYAPVGPHHPHHHPLPPTAYSLSTQSLPSSYPSSTASSPPIVCAGDAIARIVPNVEQYTNNSTTTSGSHNNNSYPTTPSNAATLQQSNPTHAAMNGYQQQQQQLSAYPLHPNHNHHHQLQQQQQHQQQQQQHQQLLSSMPPLPPSTAMIGGCTLQEQFAAAIGIMCDVACTPRGRSMLQAVLRLRQADHIQLIYNELCANDEMISRMMVEGNACHVVRSLIEVVDASLVESFVGPTVMTESLIIELATLSQHTRRILQSIFERFSAEAYCDAIIAILAKHAQYLATTQQGCIALMRVIDYAQSAQRNQLHRSLFPAMAHLATDPYGNYVIQHMVERGDVDLISEAVVVHFLPHCVVLCCNKYASNVMEKVFYNISASARPTLLDAILMNNQTLHVLMHDSYGNFVIQSAIDSCTNYNEYRTIADRMRPLIHTSPYGHKIEAKLKSKRSSKGMLPPPPLPQMPNSSSSASAGNPTHQYLPAQQQPHQQQQIMPSSSNLSSSAASSEENTAPSTPRSSFVINPAAQQHPQHDACHVQQQQHQQQKMAMFALQQQQQHHAAMWPHHHAPPAATMHHHAQYNKEECSLPAY